MARFHALYALTALLLARPELVSAYWREACSVAQEERIDPILSPGTISSHVHKFAGGINVGPSSTDQTLQASNCSTCQVQADKSAYWTPALYYQHPDGTFESVPNDGMTVYYVGRGGDASNTKPFPPGFQMVSGDTRLRSYNTTDLTYENVRPIADRVSFRCINQANNIAETHYINDTNCVNGFRAQLNFQSCWDGKNLYLDNSAHVAYLSGIDYGVCPPSHPIPIPGLFYEVLYWVNDINQRPGGRFVFANGDSTGYGFHGDFINGWDQTVLDNAVQNCLYTDNGGVVTACAALVPSNNVNFARICPQVPPTILEQVYGNLTKLPGCNPITFVEMTPIICPVNSTASGSPLVSSSTTSSSSTSSTRRASSSSISSNSGSTMTATTPSNSTTSSSSIATAAVTSSHPPLLVTASLSLRVSTITTFITVTATASRPIITSAAIVSLVADDISGRKFQ